MQREKRIKIKSDYGTNEPWKSFKSQIYMYLLSLKERKNWKKRQKRIYEKIMAEVF